MSLENGDITDNELSDYNSKYKNFKAIDLKNGNIIKSRIDSTPDYIDGNFSLIDLNSGDIIENKIYTKASNKKNLNPKFKDTSPTSKIKNINILNVNSGNIKNNEINVNFQDNENFTFLKTKDAKAEGNNFSISNENMTNDGFLIDAQNSTIANNNFYADIKSKNFTAIKNKTKDIENNKFRLLFDINKTLAAIENGSGNISKNYITFLILSQSKNINLLKTSTRTIDENNISINRTEGEILNGITSNSGKIAKNIIVFYNIFANDITAVKTENSEILDNNIYFSEIKKLDNATILSSKSGDITGNTVNFDTTNQLLKLTLAKTTGDIKDNKFIINPILLENTTLITGKNISSNEISNCGGVNFIKGSSITFLKSDENITDNNITLCNANIEGNLLFFNSAGTIKNNLISIQNSEISNNIFSKNSVLTIFGTVEVGGDIISDNGVLNIIADDLKARNLSGFKKSISIWAVRRYLEQL